MGCFTLPINYHNKKWKKEAMCFKKCLKCLVTWLKWHNTHQCTMGFVPSKRIPKWEQYHHHLYNNFHNQAQYLHLFYLISTSWFFPLFFLLSLFQSKMGHMGLPRRAWHGRKMHIDGFTRFKFAMHLIWQNICL